MSSEIYPLDKYLHLVFMAQDWLGWNEKTVFHPYWLPADSPVRFAKQTPRLLASAYTNGERYLAIIVNDTPETVKTSLNLDEPVCGKSGKAVNVFNQHQFIYSGGRLELDMQPREALLHKFIKQYGVPLISLASDITKHRFPI